MSDSTSDQPAPTPPGYTDADLRRWLTDLAAADDNRGVVPFRLQRAVLVDLLAYREAEAAAGAFYRRPDGIEDVEWMRPYVEEVFGMVADPGYRDRLLAILDGVYVRAAENAAVKAGQSALLATELRRLMPAGLSTLDAVRSAVDRLDRVREAMLRDGGRLTDPAAILDLQGAHSELRAVLPKLTPGPGPVCACPDDPSLLCPVPQHRADAAIQGFSGPPDDLARFVVDEAFKHPEYARALHEQRHPGWSDG